MQYFNEKTINESLALARELQEKINSNLTKKEKTFREKMMKLLENPKSKVMLIELLDRSFRTSDFHASYELISFTINKYGMSDFFTTWEKILLQAFLSVGGTFPTLSVPFFVNHLKNDTKAMVLSNNPITLKAHSEARKKENIGLNVNLIGEEVLGSAEADYRMQKYQDVLNSDYINYISIKITTIFSQINILDYEWSKKEIVTRLDALYQLAQNKQNAGIQKFINLDMEEYKDLELTVDAFMESLDKFDIKAGIVLQAYIPDSFKYLKKLVDYSRKRVESGKKPIKIRIVKGANMESEETIASVKDWELVTFRNKVDTDSNYNKMLNYILENKNYKYINIGVASHNIFQIAYAMTRIREEGAGESFTFEMLEGMNLKASFEVASRNHLILYAPVCDDKHFNNAIAYLIRRLDENTGKDNFMRYAFDLKVDSKTWKQQEKIFLDSLKGIPSIQERGFRSQNRLVAPFTKSMTLSEFKNEADTDFIMPENREWALKIKEKYENLNVGDITPIIGESRPKDNKRTIYAKGSQDKNDTSSGKPIANLYTANKDTIKNALDFLKKSKVKLSFEEMGNILLKVAEVMAEHRGDLMGISALEVGKTFLETDPEVSEAIDFLRFYAHSVKKLINENKNIIFSPKGIGVAITPWNFPVGISVGSISAALASGNRVIYKPSNLSSLTGSMICEYFYKAGLPKDYLVFLPSSGRDINEYLLGEVDFAILTGGEDTAYDILKKNPTLFLTGETGGKNATIVSKMADRDQAIKNVIHSAFSNSGQKCSATSLLILEKEVYEDQNFRKSLIDAANSMSVGNPFELRNKIGYLSDFLSEKVEQGLKADVGEEFALSPNFVDSNTFAMKPVIKYGVKMGSFSHMNEFFTPILSVICAKDLANAIEIANSTGYGLTSGFESLDEREWDYWIENIEAGNMYINKSTTGAVVLRQPFGGIKKSAIGFGRKVGIYNYVTQFMRADTKNYKSASYNISPIGLKIKNFVSTKLSGDKLEADFNKLIDIANDYFYYNENEFLTKKDYVNIRGEDNYFFYKPVKSVALRATKDDTIIDIMSIIIAAATIGTKLTLSMPGSSIGDSMGFILENLKHIGLNEINIDYSKDEDFIKNIGDFDLIRYLKSGNVDNIIYKGAAERAKIIANHKPFPNGYLELLYYHTERALSIAYHRYGNLGRRALDKK